ncbi:MAG: hypothetical protein ACQEQU_02985 [Spirochaetota bacterium]
MPETCLLCGNGNKSICLACFREIQQHSIDQYISYTCKRCGYPLFSVDDFCPFCSLEGDLPYTQRLFLYKGIIHELLELYHHTGESRCIPLLGHLLYKHLKQSGNDMKEQLLIPIPDTYHARKDYHVGRMYSVCRYIARTYSLAMCDALKHTPKEKQSLSGNREATCDVAGHTFEIKKSHLQRLKGKALCLIDDRIVTGKRLQAAQSVLSRAEPKEISALVLAMD